MRPRLQADGNDGEVLDAMADFYERVIVAYNEFTRTTSWVEQPDAPAARERDRAQRQYGPGGDWNGEELQHAHGTAWVFTVVASQHIAGMETLLRGYEVIFPLAPVSRSVMEIAGRVAWLLDPRISQQDQIRDRAARSFMSRLDDFARLESTAKSLKAEGVAEIRSAKRTLRRRLPEVFYPSEIDFDEDEHLVSLRGQRVPSFRQSQRILSDIQTEDWNAVGVYDLLASASHPTLSVAVQMFGLNPPDDARPDDKPSYSIRLDDATYPHRLCRLTAIAFLETWALLAAYRGMDYAVVNELLHKLDELPRLSGDSASG